MKQKAGAKDVGESTTKAAVTVTVYIADCRFSNKLDFLFVI